MRRLSVVFLLVLLSLITLPLNLPTASAATGTLYDKTWGGSNFDYGQAVGVDSAGNSSISGYTWSFTPGTPSIFLLKYSFTGHLLTQRIWSDGAYDYAFGEAVDHSKNIYIAGWTNNLGSPAILLLKFSFLGALLWQRTVGGSSNPAYGQGVALDSTGNIYVVGYYASTSSADQNATVIKFDPSGNVIWQRSWGGGNPDQAKSVAVDSSGNIYVAGFTNSFGGGAADVFLLKFNSTGGLLKATTWGGTGDDIANGVAVDGSGNVYVTGGTTSGGLTNQAFLLKFTSSGSLTWKYLYRLTGATIGNSIAVNSVSNSLWIAGSTMVGSYTKGIILTFSLTGKLTDQVSWGGNGGSDAGYALADDTSGNVMMAGYVSESGPYPYSALAGTLSNSSLTTTNPSVPISDPGLLVGFASGTVTSVSGSTSYAGGSDVYLTKYGTLPSVLFLSSPNTGTINFTGTIYQSGDSGSYAYGSYQVLALSGHGWVFENWTATGSISVSDKYSNPVTVTVSGSGTLSANFGIAIANVTIDISPVTGGTVTCNGQVITGNQTVIHISVNTTLACTANRYAGDTFLQWTGIASGTSTQISFNVTRGGILEADFKVPVVSLPPPGIIFSALTLAFVVLVRREKK